MDANNSTDSFERLSIDVIIFILQKLPEGNDLKFLTQCSLVSHRLASAILHVPHVKLTLPSLPYPSPEIGFNYILDGLKSQVKSTYKNTTNLLTKFRDLRSLHLVFSKHDYDNDEQVEGFMLSHLNMTPYTMAYLSKSNYMYPDVLSECYGDCYPGSKFEYLKRLNIWMEVILWHDLLVLSINDFPILQSVRISNPNLSVCISDEELLKMKTLKMMGKGREIMMKMRRYLEHNEKTSLLE